MRVLLFIAGLAALASCSPDSKPASDAASGPAASATCADGAAKLAGTGLCQADANALLGADPDVRTPELEGCTWSVKEIMLPGDEALLYRAASCNGVDTTLAFAGGAHRAELSYEASAVHGDSGKGRVVVALYGVEPDPQGALKAAIADLPARDRGSCQITPIEREGWPRDALFIAPSVADQEKLFKGGPVVACGPLGIDETRQRYWRVRQGFAWFFDLGDKDPDFDAGNMAVVAKAADGSWRKKP